MKKINVDQEAVTRDSVYLSNGETKVWVLKSDIVMDKSEKEDGKFTSITIPKSVAIEKGLV